MSYETSPRSSYSAADAFQGPSVYVSEPGDIVLPASPTEAEVREVILFHLLAVEESGQEHWIQNEFIFDPLDRREIRTTLRDLTYLEQEGTVRDMKVIRRTAQQEWLY